MGSMYRKNDRAVAILQGEKTHEMLFYEGEHSVYWMSCMVTFHRDNRNASSSLHILLSLRT